MPTFLTDLLEKYVFFLGRASRTEFWLSFLVFCGLYYFIGVIDVAGITFGSDEFSRLNPMMISALASAISTSMAAFRFR